MRLQDLTHLLTGLLPLFSQRRPAPSPRRRSFEQGDWLAELELLQLAQELKALADQRGSFEAELFDLVVSIADVLAVYHGWPRSQSNQWLVRMGVWEEGCKAAGEVCVGGGAAALQCMIMPPARLALMELRAVLAPAIAAPLPTAVTPC